MRVPNIVQIFAIAIYANLILQTWDILIIIELTYPPYTVNTRLSPGGLFVKNDFWCGGLIEVGLIPRGLIKLVKKSKVIKKYFLDGQNTLDF